MYVGFQSVILFNAVEKRAAVAGLYANFGHSIASIDIIKVKSYFSLPTVPPRIKQSKIWCGFSQPTSVSVESVVIFEIHSTFS